MQKTLARAQGRLGNGARAGRGECRAWRRASMQKTLARAQGRLGNGARAGRGGGARVRVVFVTLQKSKLGIVVLIINEEIFLACF